MNTIIRKIFEYPKRKNITIKSGIKLDKLSDSLINHSEKLTNLEKQKNEKIKELEKISLELRDAVHSMGKVSQELITKLNNKVKKLSVNFDIVSNNIQDGIIVIDYRGNIIDLNNKLLEIFHYSREDLLEKSIDSIIPINMPEYIGNIHPLQEIMAYISPEMYAYISTMIFNHLKNDDPTKQVDSILNLINSNRYIIAKTKNGTMIYIDLIIKLLPDHEINSVEDLQFVCIIKNIDPLIRAKQNIENLKLFQFSLLESIPIIVFWKNKNFEYIGHNTQFEAFVNKSTSAILGSTENYFDFLRDNEIDVKKRVQSISPDQKIQTDFEPKKASLNIKDTHYELIIYNSLILDKDGNFNGYICSMINISDICKHCRSVERMVPPEGVEPSF